MNKYKKYLKLLVLVKLLVLLLGAWVVVYANEGFVTPSDWMLTRYFLDAHFRSTHRNMSFHPAGHRRSKLAITSQQRKQVEQWLKERVISIGIIPFKKGELRFFCQHIKRKYHGLNLKDVTIFWPIHYHSPIKKYFSDNQPSMDEFEECLNFFQGIESLYWVPHIEEIETLTTKHHSWRMYSRADLDKEYFERAFAPLKFMLEKKYFPRLKTLFLSVAAESDRSFYRSLDGLTRHMHEVFMELKKNVPGSIYWVWAPNGDTLHWGYETWKNLKCGPLAQVLQKIDLIAPSVHWSSGHLKGIHSDWPTIRKTVAIRIGSWLTSRCGAYFEDFIEKKLLSLTELSLKPSFLEYANFFRTVREERKAIPMESSLPITLWNIGSWDHLSLLEFDE